jgi:hypothetical protein
MVGGVKLQLGERKEEKPLRLLRLSKLLIFTFTGTKDKFEFLPMLAPFREAVRSAGNRRWIEIHHIHRTTVRRWIKTKI